MTFDDVLKAAFGVVLASLAGAWAWLRDTVSKNRDRLLVLEGRVAQIEKDQVTVECVREVMTEELDRREAAAEKRRTDRAELFLTKMQAGQDKLKQDILETIRAETSRFKKE